MTLANKRTTLGLKASLMAPVLAIGLAMTAPASAAGLGGISTLGDIDVAAAGNIIEVGRYGARHRGHRRGRHAKRHYQAQRAYNHRRKSRRRRRRNAAIGIGIGILGAAILANRHYDRRPAYAAPRHSYRDSYRAAKRKCARVYGEDYVWRSDLVYDEYGDARVCKFVRRAGY